MNQELAVRKQTHIYELSLNSVPAEKAFDPQTGTFSVFHTVVHTSYFEGHASQIEPPASCTHTHKNHTYTNLASTWALSLV